MKTKLFRRMAALLLCAALSLALSNPVLAAGPGIVIRITPPHSASDRQAVEVLITDYAGQGFRSAKAGMGGVWYDLALERLGNQYYGVMDVTGNQAVQVHVTGMDGTVYEKSREIRTNAPADLSGMAPTVQTLAAVPLQATAPAATEPVSALKSPTALTPSGQGTVVDNVTSENGKEFYTISTPEDNIFFLVVDKERENENVYFLNAVTESDLLALAEKDENAPTEPSAPEPAPVCTCQEKCVPGMVNTACPVCVLSMKDCTGKTVTVAGPAQPETKQSSGLFLVLLTVLAVGGAGWYLKIYKPKKELDKAEDFEELIEEETVNEDMDEDGYKGYPEDEPDEPEDYGE